MAEQMESNILRIMILLLFSACGSERPTPLSSNDQMINDPIGIIEDTFEGFEYVVYANPAYQVMVAYERSIDGDTLSFKSTPGDFPNIMIDNEGNKWNVFGKATDGPRKGQVLNSMNTTIGYFFCFGAFFPEVSAYSFGPGQKIEQGGENNEWTVDKSFVFVGAAKDGIPSIDNPTFVPHTTGKTEVTYIEDDELVVTYLSGDLVKVIPHKVLDYHEIVNDWDNFGSRVVSYCPLTGTSNVWGSTVNNMATEFGVSGLLYNSNLVLYDRQTDTKWSQIKQEAINGSNIGEVPAVLPYAEMTWSAAKQLGKTIMVLDPATGFNRDYDLYPYGDYKTNHDRIGTPLTYTDERVPSKERVLSILVDGRSKVYRFSDFK